MTVQEEIENAIASYWAWPPKDKIPRIVIETPARDLAPPIMRADGNVMPYADALVMGYEELLLDYRQRRMFLAFPATAI